MQRKYVEGIKVKQNDLKECLTFWDVEGFLLRLVLLEEKKGAYISIITHP